MSSESRANIAASVRARLLRLAQESGEDYQRVLGRYGIERFLYRLGNSSYRDRFALKGATLFTLWTGQTHRPTKDLDLLGRGSSAIDEVEAVMREICGIQDDDGIAFDAKTITGTRIKEDDEYDGVRVRFNAHLAGARIPMQVDIGFGDAVFPEPELATFPVLLPMVAPQIRAYPRESLIAEKLHAMVELDIRNSRMKDFYDIWYMARIWAFEMPLLRRAIVLVFERRGLALPDGTPVALSADFLNDPQKKQQWNAFISRLNNADAHPPLDEVGALLRAFLLPCLHAELPAETKGRRWLPGAEWTDAAG